MYTDAVPPALPESPYTVRGPVIMVALSRLVLDSTPRLNGQDTEHARLLAEMDATLPPILIQRHTMRVIDGAHRVLAARLNGNEAIAAQFYDGDDDDAFVVSVERNVAHGMPLTRADRQAAAARIVKSHPHWSDRSIASRIGLSDRTVRAIRSTAGVPRSNHRLGRDGRVRPLSAADGRRRASQILSEQPGTPLRKVADAAGVSLATAHDVRQRMRRGDDPVPTRRNRAGRAAEPSLPHPGGAASENMGLRLMLHRLAKDPSLKYTDSGRSLLRWLHSHAMEDKDWAPLLDTIPDHCRRPIANIARSIAGGWQDFAAGLENGLETSSPYPHRLAERSRSRVSEMTLRPRRNIISACRGPRPVQY